VVSPPGVQGQDDLVDLAEATLPLLHDDRLEGALTITGHLEVDLARGVGQDRLAPGAVADVAGVPLARGPVLLVAEVLGHLLVQGRLQDGLGELLQQPVRPGQG